MPTLESHTARLNVRLSPDIKMRVEQAAHIAGMSVSDFAVSHLAAAADTVVRQHNELILGNVERDFFLHLLEEPDAPITDAAREAATRYKERKSREHRETSS